MAQKKNKEADELLSQNLTVLIIMGAAITAPVLIFTEPIARLLGSVVTNSNNGIFTDFIVPEGCVFAMGDNREHSIDCRKFGCIPLEKIEGKVTIRFWPLNKIGKIEKAE